MCMSSLQEKEVLQGLEWTARAENFNGKCQMLPQTPQKLSGNQENLSQLWDVFGI